MDAHCKQRAMGEREGVIPRKRPRVSGGNLSPRARKRAFLRVSVAKRAASYSKAYCEAIRKLTRNMVRRFCFPRPRGKIKDAVPCYESARGQIPLARGKPRALVQEATRYARRKAHCVRSADAGSSWGEFIPPHPPRTLRVRMFCIRKNYPRPPMCASARSFLHPSRLYASLPALLAKANLALQKLPQACKSRMLR